MVTTKPIQVAIEYRLRKLHMGTTRTVLDEQGHHVFSPNVFSDACECR